MLKPKDFLRKVFIGIAGFLVISVGVILLVLPGPGLAIIALGLFILTLEFEWADRYFKRFQREFEKYWAKVKKSFK